MGALEACSKILYHQFSLIEMGWYLVSRITDMIFFLDNFDVNFLNCVNRFVLALIITIIIIYL